MQKGDQKILENKSNVRCVGGFRLKQVLSYGGGVQTFAMLVLIEKGILPKPDFLIMADTVAEYPATYAHVEQVAKPLAKKLGIEWIDVQHEAGLIEGYKRQNGIPMPGFRSCTYNFKVRPIHDYLREYLGENKKRGKPSIVTWIGISTDEKRRAVPREKQSPKWIEMRYPLLELGFSRDQLKQFIEESPYPMPIKSGCFLCPYNGLKGFVDLKANHPELMEIAVEMEEAFFKARPDRTMGFLPDHQITLKELNQIPSLFSFENVVEPNRECENEGSCFL
jgi:hypothetical protein